MVVFVEEEKEEEEEEEKEEEEKGWAWLCRLLELWVRRSIPSGLSPGMLFVRQIASARHETPNFTNPVLMALDVVGWSNE